jgi:hypothetical protein
LTPTVASDRSQPIVDDSFFWKNREDLARLLANSHKLWHDAKNHRAMSQRMG